jgi:DNA/RNA-binding protein KIN17
MATVAEGAPLASLTPIEGVGGSFRKRSRWDTALPAAGSTAAASSSSSSSSSSLSNLERLMAEEQAAKAKAEARRQLEVANAAAATAAAAAAPAQGATPTSAVAAVKPATAPAPSTYVAAGAPPTASSARREDWLLAGIVVKVINKKLANGKYYKQKGVVQRVEDTFAGVVKMMTQEQDGGGGDLLKLDQEDLETVVPDVGGIVLLVNGPHRGRRGTVATINIDDFCADIRTTDGDMLCGIQYEDFSRLAPQIR